MRRGTRRSWSWALLGPEYLQGGRVRSRCCRNLAPPSWIPRRTRTERRFLNSLKHFPFRHVCTGNRRKKSAESSHAVVYQCEMRHLCAEDARNGIVGLQNGAPQTGFKKQKQECEQHCSRGGRLVCQPANGFAEDQQSKNMHYLNQDETKRSLLWSNGAPKRPQTHLQGYYLPQKLKVEVIDWPSMPPDLT